MARKSVQSVSDTIGEVEGFVVRFVIPGEDERHVGHRRVEEYPFVKAANKSWTVAQWRAKRFQPHYPEFEVEVINGEGSPVHGKTLLTTVRNSYAFEEERSSGPSHRASAVQKSPLAEMRAASNSGEREAYSERGPAAVNGAAAASTLTLGELESRLWAAANSLRGPVDPADFKSYVFPLLFMKWVSDTWDLEHTEAVADFGSDVSQEEEADYHRFAVPEGCHWSDLRKVSVNVGVTLQNILQRLEEANPQSLAGIFGDVTWANKERLPEPSLLNLIDAFDRMVLNRNVVSNDMLGAAYEYLLRQFADASGKKAGEFFTPRAVVRLLVRILDPQQGESAYDPACGSGGMLVETINEVREAGGDTRTLRLYGQEVNLTTAAIARMNLFLHDLEDFRIVRGDTLRDPRFLERSGLRNFDVVVANPPFSLKNWGADTWANDPYGRAFCGVPPLNTADFAWVQHMVASMRSDTGRVGVVMPHGALFRGGLEKSIRQCLIQSDQLEAVIGLPPNLFYSTSIPACLFILRAEKSHERRGTVLLVDASERFMKGRNQNQMEEEDIAAILAAYQSGAEHSSIRARLVKHSEIEKHNWDLNIARYIITARPDTVSVKDSLDRLAVTVDAVHDAEERLNERLRAAGYA